MRSLFLLLFILGSIPAQTQSFRPEEIARWQKRAKKLPSRATPGTFRIFTEKPTLTSFSVCCIPNVKMILRGWKKITSTPSAEWPK
jgi:hypothetical protein